MARSPGHLGARVGENRDGWTYIFQDNESRRAKTPEEATELRRLADFRKMEEIRARVDAIVKDPVTAEALKPYYYQMCKRPCFHDEYLDTFNRPNVKLVDTEVFASGFEVTTEYTRRLGFDIHGRGGKSLRESWAENAPSWAARSSSSRFCGAGARARPSRAWK